MKTLASLSLAACILATPLAAQAPNTDVFLAPLKRIRDSIVVGPAVNVTHRPGYDNQPSFTLDSRTLLYTAIGADAQADIWRYDIAAKRTSQVTSTSESEYSAVVMPGGTRMSVIRVEADSTQRLWSFALDGSDPQVLLPTLKPIGYHAWLSGAKLVVFVLGSPSTLHVVNSDGTDDQIRARDAGRSLNRIPGMDAFSYVARDSEHIAWITAHYVAGGTDASLIHASLDNEYHVWTPDRILLTTYGNRLVRWNGAIDSTAKWSVVADLATSHVKNVTRLAVSPDGKWLAFVAEPTTP